MRRERIVGHSCGNDLKVRWIRAGKMKWIKKEAIGRNGKMLRFFYQKFLRFVKPYPAEQQTKGHRWIYIRIRTLE